MQSTHCISPIRILPNQLADQIAAGEVIERPASVLKELVENSLDAGCTRVDIELSRGGMESLRVTDDGHGIAGNELMLAVSRHATSKISQLEDLLQLQSLGFRGEALASICSVSQWEISSRRIGDENAYALRHDHVPRLVPVNHAVGTSVSIRKLFFNTPARRKFLRAERTEFRHCDEVIRRMALARFDVAYYLKHNGRQVLRLPAVTDDTDRSRRVGQLCGEAFVRNSLVIDYPHSGMRLWGWISRPDFSRQQTDLQFFYINGRIIRDRVINHALRHAYESFLSPGRHAAFVLHLELDPAIVDVNVHPTKHEVRFREARRIHDFLIRCLRDSLQQPVPVADYPAVQTINDIRAEYASTTLSVGHAFAPGRPASTSVDSYFGNIQTILLNRFILTHSLNGLYLIDIQCVQVMLSRRYWQQAYEAGEIKTRPVLIPSSLQLSTLQRHVYEQQQNLLAQLGFDLTPTSPGELLLRAVPVWLQGFDSQQLLYGMLDCFKGNESVFDYLEQALLSQSLNLNSIDLRLVMKTLDLQRDTLTKCWRKLTHADLVDWLQEQQTQHE